MEHQEGMSEEAFRIMAERSEEDDRTLCDVVSIDGHVCSGVIDHAGIHECQCGEQIMSPPHCGSDERLMHGGFHYDGKRHLTIVFGMDDGEARYDNVMRWTFMHAGPSNHAQYCVESFTGHTRVREEHVVLAEHVRTIMFLSENEPSNAVRVDSAINALFPDPELQRLFDEAMHPEVHDEDTEDDE